MHKTLFIVLVTAFSTTALGADAPPTTQPARPGAQAMRVPNGFIKIDGDDSDWRAFGEAFAAARISLPAPKNLACALSPEHGVWRGPEDFSLDAWVAVDSANIYILANIHDQLLFNDAEPQEMFSGDDLEVFIDANPPAEQFAAKVNENYRQLIFRPAWINPAHQNEGIWQWEKNPGVKSGSRIHPWGYTIEVQIPKALFPNWQKNPDLETIGFDLMAADADSFGLDGPHGPMKYAGVLFTPVSHFQSPAQVGQIQISGPVLPRVAIPMHQKMLHGADKVLYAIDKSGAASVAAEAIDSKDRAERKAGLFILAKRPELKAPINKLIKMCRPDSEGKYLDHDLAGYALVALMERRELPAKAWFDFYNHAPDMETRLTWIGCAGRSGDVSVRPELENLLTDQNIRVRYKAALALGDLGDPAAIPAVEKMQEKDPEEHTVMVTHQVIEELRTKHPATK